MSNYRKLSEDEFDRALADFARPAKAVTTVQHLHGRQDTLKQGRRALRTEGAQLFIYGERGVGKTSLAKTLIAEVAPEYASDLLVACEKTSTFNSIMYAVIKRLLPICKNIASQTQVKAAFQALGFSIEVSKIWSVTEQIDATDINSFISAIKAIDKIIGNKIAIIIDEFDLLGDKVEKEKFAELVKQLSDQDVSLKIIFCGIASDVGSLIGGHYSSGRYIDPIELGPLKYGPILNIIQKACGAFEIEIEKEPLIRAALIADGYPYFMHLITKNAIEILYENPSLPAVIDGHVFEHAVRRAISKAEPMLKTAYDMATKRYSNEYEAVLWAVSALTLFENKWDDIFERSYRDIVGSATGLKVLSRENFYKRILNLTRPDCGAILTTNKNGWYKFSENVVRSYSRLRAAESGVNLGIDLHGHSGKFRQDYISQSVESDGDRSYAQ